MDIQLETHPARHLVDGELVPLITDQLMVRVDGIQVGYCGAAAGGYLQFTVPVDQATQDAVSVHVDQQLGGRQDVVVILDVEAALEVIDDDDDNGEFTNDDENSGPE